MELELLEIDDEADALDQVDLSGLPGETPGAGEQAALLEVQPLRTAEETAETAETLTEAEKTAPCVTCNGLGVVSPSKTWNIENDYTCPDCLGHGYPAISPDDPLPDTQGPGRVPYLHVRYHHGLPLWD